MSDELVDNIEGSDTEGQDNALIKSLRAKVSETEAARKAAEARAESALAEARSQLERESAAQKFVDAFGYPGLATTVLGQVEGDITEDKVKSVLEGLKLPLDGGSGTESVTQGNAEAVAQVASLGGQISAAARTTPESNFEADMAAATTPAEIEAVAAKYGFNDPS